MTDHLITEVQSLPKILSVCICMYIKQWTLSNMSVVVWIF
jgi:hypothetical protein